MKLFTRFRSARREIYETFFDARSLCITGLLVMPAFVFNPAAELRIIQFLFFWFLSWLSGKRNNPFFTLAIAAGIIAFNLIVPHGRVLFSIGAFKITFGALMGGIHRAVTLEGLVMLSRAAIRRDLRLPGIFGEVLGESLRIFTHITDLNLKQKITRKNFIAGIDALMIELSGAEIPERREKPAAKTKPAGFVILAFVVLISWLPWAALIFNPEKLVR